MLLIDTGYAVLVVSAFSWWISMAGAGGQRKTNVHILLDAAVAWVSSLDLSLASPVQCVH